MSLEEAFWARVRVADECWEWRGVRQPNGYGRLCIDGRKILAHRLSYELNVGPIPTGLLVLHRCDNKPCVRPDHLYAGTRRRNALDAIERGQHVPMRGEGHPLAVLNDELVRELRRRAAVGGVTARDLGREFGIAPDYAGQIINRKVWAHLA